MTGVSGAVYTVTIPAKQSYAENSFGNGAFPMYASATTLEGGLTFQPLMSVLKLQLTSTDSKYVRRIVVTSDTENLSGSAQVNMGNGAITWTSGNKSVELDCGEGGVELTSEAKTFHIAVPAGTSKNYCVVITTTDAGKGVGKKLTGKTFTVGQIKMMPEVSVTASTALKPIYAEGTFMGDGIAITVSSTTAIKDAGKEWIENGGPSSNQTGYKFGTSPNRVFLPAAGYRKTSDGIAYNRGVSGYYWSSSVNNNYAKRLNFNNSGVAVNKAARANGFSVRCVQE